MVVAMKTVRAAGESGEVGLVEVVDLGEAGELEGLRVALQDGKGIKRL
jgi:hypothetical protein